MEYVVGIGGYAITKNPEDVIKTFALGTCVGLVCYSQRMSVVAMAHIQLPISRATGVEEKPCRFADTAPVYLVDQLKKIYGITKQEILITLYGGVDSSLMGDMFRIGEQNLMSVKNSLEKLGLRYREVDVGGCESRTLIAYAANGIVEIIKRPMRLRTTREDKIPPRKRT